MNSRPEKSKFFGKLRTQVKASQSNLLPGVMDGLKKALSNAETADLIAAFASMALPEHLRNLEGMLQEYKNSNSSANCEAFYKHFANLPVEEARKLAALFGLAYAEYVQYIALLQDAVATLTADSYVNAPLQQRATFATLKRTSIPVYQERMKNVFNYAGETLSDCLFAKKKASITLPTTETLFKHLFPDRAVELAATGADKPTIPSPDSDASAASAGCQHTPGEPSPSDVPATTGDSPQSAKRSRIGFNFRFSPKQK